MVDESTFLLLLVIAVAVALLAHRVHLPYTAALVLAGLGIGATHLLAPPHLTQELLYGVFLPGLVFEAAFHLEYQGYRENKLAILSLAVPGVIAASALTAFLLQSEMRGITTGDWGFGEALVFGALISATDPIAVVAVFRRLGVPKRLSVLVEGETSSTTERPPSSSPWFLPRLPPGTRSSRTRWSNSRASWAPAFSSGPAWATRCPGSPRSWTSR